MAEMQDAEKCCIFVTRCRIFFFFLRSQFIATLYFLEFPWFHVPFSLGFNDELKEAQGGPS